MKRNDITALNDQTLGELEQKLTELKKDLAKAKLELSVGKLEDVRLPSKIRDDIARVKTIMTEKKMASEVKVQAPRQKAKKSEDKENK